MGLALKVIRHVDPPAGTRSGWSYGSFQAFRFGLQEVAKPGPADPIWVLLGHSDCDGALDRDECEMLATRLRWLKSEHYQGVEREGVRPYPSFWSDYYDFLGLLDAVVADEDARGLAFQ